ncbi:MAG TPA: aspartate/glutamate racemase family protein, partial [Terriglobales bacterium]|nr:aspartate/glutamate racemase family protein [Terriglobales bacterium]
MKTLGIIGGLGPESTVDYYQSLIAVYREQTNDDSYPSIIINSINLTRAIALVTANELAALAEWLASEIEKLRSAGADFALISANTPHIAFDEIARRSPLPLISIV